MTVPKITKSARGSLIHFIKGHLLETSFDKTYFHYFGIEVAPTAADFELWMNSPIQYLSEKDLILLINYRAKQANKSIDDLNQNRQISFLEWCETIKKYSKNSSLLEQTISITKAHTLFLLALKSEDQTQRKILKISVSELEALEGKEISTHPYLFYLRGLQKVALGDWQEATSQFHQASNYTHNPALYGLLINLYLHLEMPAVSRFFEQKLKKQSSLDKELMAS
jgi:hypothetical protein